MTTTAAAELAYAAAKTQWKTLPRSVQTQAEDLFVDTLAVSAAGLSHPTYAPFVAAMTGETGAASIPGIAHGVPVDTAVQINGGATTVVQLQDGHRMGRGHPASHMVPVLLAVAEDVDANAESILSAAVAGYEVGARIAIAMDGLNPLLHDTGTWSTIAAAAAAAHLLSDRTSEVINAAIESSAAVALMPFRDLPLHGASAHHLYIGLGATTGLMAARGAVAGLTHLPGTLESFFGPRTGAAFDATLLTSGIGANGQWGAFEIENAYFKVHPTCAHLHGANDAVLALIRAHDVQASDVESVEVATYAAGLAFDNPAPENVLAARFSLAASTAVALCRGALDETTLTDTTLQDPAVQDMMQRVRVSHDPDLDQSYPAGRPARVSLTRKDGTMLSESVIYPRGDHTNPLPREDRRAKSRRLLAVRYSDTDADAVSAALDAYFDGEPITAVTAALRVPARNGIMTSV